MNRKSSKNSRHLADMDATGNQTGARPNTHQLGSHAASSSYHQKKLRQEKAGQPLFTPAAEIPPKETFEVHLLTPVFRDAGDFYFLNDNRLQSFVRFPRIDSDTECAIAADRVVGDIWSVTRFFRKASNGAHENPWQRQEKILPTDFTAVDMAASLQRWCIKAGRNDETPWHNHALGSHPATKIVTRTAIPELP